MVYPPSIHVLDTILNITLLEASAFYESPFISMIMLFIYERRQQESNSYYCLQSVRTLFYSSRGGHVKGAVLNT